MFRNAFIDRLKACGDVPEPIAEAITGYGRNAFEFAKQTDAAYSWMITIGLSIKKLTGEHHLYLTIRA